MVQSLFRRRLVKKVDPHVAVAADQLIDKYANRSRDYIIGKIFEPVNHNYLYGVSLKELVERMIHLVKREKQTLEQVWKNMRWINPKNREDARTLSVMGMSQDEWSVRFAEIVMLDNKENMEKNNNGLLWGLPFELGLFYYIFGPDWKTFLMASMVGVGVSEASNLYKYNRGFSLVNFTWYGVMLQRLYATKKLFSIPSALLMILIFAPLVFDPPPQGQWKTMEGAKHTAHDLHYLTLAFSLALSSYKII